MRHHGVRPVWAPALFFALTAPCMLTPRLALAQPAPSPVATSPSVRGVIVSIRGEEASLNAGANAGLAVGMELPVLQAGEVVGHIVLTQVNAEDSVGRVITREGFTIRSLDTVRLPSTPALTPATPPEPTPRTLPATSTTESSAPERDASRPVGAFTAYGEHTSDVIPWERWEYMALSSLAADGLLPGYASRDFQGTRQFTRGQLASLTATALINFASGAGTERDRVFLDRLAWEFRFQPPVTRSVAAIQEMDLPSPAVRPAVPEIAGVAVPGLEQAPGLSLYGGLRAWDFRDESKVNVIGRVGGIVDVGKNAFVALSVTNLHDRFSALPDAFAPIDVLTLNFRALDTDWEVGKSYWSSGPLHSGDGLLSDNAPGLYMVKARKTFSWGRFLGKFLYTQIYGGFRDDGDTKYYGLRRIEKRLSKTVELGLSEAYVATKAPNPTILVLPFYAYQHLEIFNGGSSNTGNDTFNYMAQVDLSLRVNAGFTTYGEIFIDDISAPSGLGAGFDVPRKIGMVLGAHFPKLFGRRGDMRFEIYHADRETYLGIAPQVGWNYKNLNLGSPFGPNSQAFYGRIDYKVTDKLKTTMQLRDAVQYKNGLPDVGDRWEWDLRAAYDLQPNQSISLRFINQRLRGQNYTLRDDAIELLGTYAY